MKMTHFGKKLPNADRRQVQWPAKKKNYVSNIFRCSIDEEQKKSEEGRPICDRIRMELLI